MVQQNNNYQCFFHRRFRLIAIIVLCCIFFLFNHVKVLTGAPIDSLTVNNAAGTVVPLFVMEGTRIMNLKKINSETKFLFHSSNMLQRNLLFLKKSLKKEKNHSISTEKEIQIQEELNTIIYPVQNKGLVKHNFWEKISALPVPPNISIKFLVLAIRKITTLPKYFAQVPKNKIIGATSGYSPTPYLHTTYGGVRPLPLVFHLYT